MKKARLFLFAFGMMGVLAFSFFPVQEAQAQAACLWLSKAGAKNTWLEGSCYGSGTECAANICTGEKI